MINYYAGCDYHSKGVVDIVYYYISVAQAKLGRVMLLQKSSSRIPNLDSVFGKDVAVEFIGDSLPFGVVYDENNKSVRAATVEERKRASMKRLYTGVSILGKVWTKNDFTLDTFVKRNGDTMSGTLNITTGVPIRIPHNSGIHVYLGNGGTAKFGRTSGQEIILAEGVSKSTVGSPMQVNGNLNVNGVISATGDVVGMSDRRIKKDMESIEDYWNIINNLKGYRYRLKKDNTRHIGLIAQEVEDVLPEAVFQDKETGYKAIAYGNLAGIFIEALKDIKRRLDKLDGGE